MKVLVVDDEPLLLASTELLLRAMGHEVACLRRADKVVETARRAAPDVLLQDIRMPGLDVADLVPRLQGDPHLRQMRIVLFSASMELAEMGSRLGVEVLEKPFHPQDMAQLLERAPSCSTVGPPPAEASPRAFSAPLRFR